MSEAVDDQSEANRNSEGDETGSSPAVSGPTAPSERGVLGVALQPLAKAYIATEGISWWIFTGIVGLLSVAGLIIAWINGGRGLVLAIVALSLLGLVLVLVWASVKWPKLAYRHMRVGFGEIGIEYRRGVVWRSTTIIPRNRVQHTDVAQGPIMRRYGIATLSIHTAGTTHAKVDIPGLPLGEAQRIRDELLRSHGGGSEKGREREVPAKPELSDVTEPAPASGDDE